MARDGDSVAGRALVALLVVQVLFGAMPVLGKLAIPAFGPGGVAAARMIAGAVAFFVAARALGVPPLPLREQPRVMLLSVLGISANQLLFLHGLARTSATHAALLTTSIPVLTMLAAWALGRERLSPHRIAGIALALAGVAFLVTGRDDAGAATLAGDLLVVANCSVYAVYLVLSRDLLERVPPLAALPWLFAWGAVGALPLTGLPPLAGHDAGAWVALAVIVVGPTIGTYWLNLFALRTVPSSVVALFVYLQPFVAAALAIPLLGERPTVRAVAALLLTFAGVWVATRPRRPFSGAPAAG
ncbi:MAG: DMT family transporter [Myxococcota bacterium]